MNEQNTEQRRKVIAIHRSVSERKVIKLEEFKREKFTGLLCLVIALVVVVEQVENRLTPLIYTHTYTPLMCLTCHKYKSFLYWSISQRK